MTVWEGEQRGNLCCRRFSLLAALMLLIAKEMTRGLGCIVAAAVSTTLRVVIGSVEERAVALSWWEAWPFFGEASGPFWV